MKEKTLEEATQECKDFFSDLDTHIEKLKTSVDYQENNEKLTFPKDRKLYLEIYVKNPELTRYLYKWLYSNSGNTYLFGCKLNAIHFQPPGIEALKQKLNEFINTL